MRALAALARCEFFGQQLGDQAVAEQRNALAEVVEIVFHGVSAVVPVGDRLHGLLTIDLGAAPPDLRPLDPYLGIYDAASRSGGFISGNGDPLVALVFQDSVSVLDRGGLSNDEHYTITDQWRTPNGTGQMGINLIANNAGFDLVTGDRMAQTIDARPSAALQVMGYINKVVRSATSSVVLKATLLFDRVTITPPGSCKA